MNRREAIKHIVSGGIGLGTGATLATAINQMIDNQSVQQPANLQQERVGYWDHNIKNWIPPEAGIYRVHREYDGRLNMGYVEVDKGGDGKYDYIVKFWHKTPHEKNPTFYTPSFIELYERCSCGTQELSIRGFPAYHVIGRLVERHTCERGISDEQFKEEAQRFFEKNGLDSRVLDHEKF